MAANSTNSTVSSADVLVPMEKVTIWYATGITLSGLGTVSYLTLLWISLSRTNGKTGCGLLLAHLFIVEMAYASLLYPLATSYTFFARSFKPLLDCGHLFNAFSLILHVGY